ncbi:MAG: hypothetical protein QXG71_01690 [Nanopusillaceae archaeon]
MLEYLSYIAKDSYKQILILSTTFVLFLSIIVYLFPNISTDFFAILVTIYVITAIQIILVSYYKIKYSLDKDLQYFLTYIYSISFTTTNIKRFFQILSESEEYPEISKVIKRIIYISEKYNFTFPEAIRYVLPYIVNCEFKGFLERLSTALETGEDLPSFLEREHKKALENFDVRYRKGLENVRILQEIGVSIMSSLAFVFVIILILPIIMQINIFTIFIYFITTFISANAIIYFLSRYFIPEDQLWIPYKEKPDNYLKLKNLFVLLLSISILIFSISYRIFQNTLICFSISILPLMYISYKFGLLEKQVKKKEEKFSSFYNTIISLSGVFGTNQVKILESAKIHDFGELNNDINNLYNRIIITRNYKSSWYYFIIEIGSNLISKIITPFYKMLEHGGEIEEASKKLYDVLLKVLELRSFKIQFIAGARGFLYGGFIAFSAVLFVTTFITAMMKTLFESLSTLVSAEIGGMLGIPLFEINIDIKILEEIINLLIIFQAFMISITLRNIDGGSKFGIFIDFALLIWIATGIYIITNMFFGQILPSFMQVPSP